MRNLVYILLFFPLWVFAQNELPKGMNFDDDAYEKVDVKVQLMTRDYTVLPKSFSLKPYCPTPGYQQGGTCVGWSSAYAARTILEAQQNGWTDKTTITNNAFSGYYIYANIKDKTDTECGWGSFISDAMQLMIDKGVPKHKDFTTACPSSVSSTAYQQAAPYKIKSYARLFEGTAEKDFQIRAMKKALSSGNPVVIGMKCPDSFGDAKGYWAPEEDPSGSYGGHAMCVMGYDDNMYGGAFEIINSWGTTWGNQGFIWIKYDDFAEFTKYAYEPIALAKKTTPDIVDLSGEIKMELSTGGTMLAQYATRQGNVGYYKMKQPYTSGTKFRIYISNNEPAFVYAFGSDATTQDVFTIFPHKSGVSAALNYKSNNVALPDESHWIKMDNTVGTDYMCVVYSKEPLNIESIKTQIKQQSGNFVDKVNKVLSSKLVKGENTTFNAGTIQFSAKSKGQSVVAMVVETTHQ
jgi:hypothetical protein